MIKNMNPFIWKLIWIDLLPFNNSQSENNSQTAHIKQDLTVLKFAYRLGNLTQK